MKKGIVINFLAVVLGATAGFLFAFAVIGVVQRVDFWSARCPAQLHTQEMGVVECGLPQDHWGSHINKEVRVVWPKSIPPAPPTIRVED